LTIPVTSVNDLPTAVSETAAAVLEDSGAVTYPVLSNDTFGGDGPSTTTDLIIGAVVGGTVTLNNGGTPNNPTDDQIVFTPAANFIGTATVQYTITDADGDTSTATLTIPVTNVTPVAQYQSLTTCKNTALAITLTGTDPQIDPLNPTLHALAFGINSAAPHGALSGNTGAVTYTAPHTASVTMTYTPDLDFVGTDTFTFIVTDAFGAFGIGTVTVTVQECEPIAGGGGGGGVFAHVVINEVAWGGTEASPQDQWIELRNNTDQSIDLTDWMLRWRRKHPTTPEEEQWKIVYLSGTIAPDGYYLLERLHEDTVSDVTANLIYDTTPPYSLELSALGEVIELVNADDAVVDTANADHPERDGWIAGIGSDGLPPFGTMERIDPLSLDKDENWDTNRRIVVNGLDAAIVLLTATAAMVNENTLIQGLAQATPQVVQRGEQVTVVLNSPLAASMIEGLPQVTLVQLYGAAGGGGTALEPGAQEAALSVRRAGGVYEVSIATSALAPGRYGVLISMGGGVSHLMVLEIVAG